MATKTNEEARQGQDDNGAGRGQPSTLARFGETLRRLPKYTMLTWSLLRDDRLDRMRKGLLIAGLGYLAMPLDLVPGFIPVAGQLDDLAAILLALRTVLRSLPAVVAEEHLNKAGLAMADLDHDLRTLGMVAAWLVRRAGSLALRGLGLAAGALVDRASLPLRRRRARA